jgi:hypothetical protein
MPSRSGARLSPVLGGRSNRDRRPQLSAESEVISDKLMVRWDRVIRPSLVQDGSRGRWRYNGPVEHTQGFDAGVARLEEIADEGDMEAAEQLAELVALDGPAHDAAKAYKWYYIALSQQGYSVAFEDRNGTPPDYRGPVGDFRNESMVSGLVSELGFDRAQDLDREAAAWLSRKGLRAGGT